MLLTSTYPLCDITILEYYKHITVRSHIFISYILSNKINFCLPMASQVAYLIMGIFCVDFCKTRTILPCWSFRRHIFLGASPLNGRRNILLWFVTSRVSRKVPLKVIQRLRWRGWICLQPRGLLTRERCVYKAGGSKTFRGVLEIVGSPRK